MPVNIYGVGRSGTTFVRQVLQKVTGYSIHSNHEIDRQITQPTLIVIRDLRDVMVSRWRIRLSSENRYDEVYTRLMTLDEIDYELNSSSEFIRQIESISNVVKNNGNNKNIIKVYYERYMTEKYYLFDIFQSLDSAINKKDYEEAIEIFSIKENKIKADQSKSFLTWDRNGIHGHHIFKGEIGKWSENVMEGHHDYVNTKLKNYLRIFGYQI